MSDLAVREVASRRDLARFVDLPYRLHRGDPCWTPSLRRDVRKLLSPEHPFFLQAEAACFLAEREGRVVGRVAAIENAAHNRFHEDRVGFFGFFECADDPEAARALLERSAGWLSARGLEAMRGPVSPSTNGECGLVVGDPGIHQLHGCRRAQLQVLGHPHRPHTALPQLANQSVASCECLAFHQGFPIYKGSATGRKGP